jgi:hypothetical protein
MTVSISSSLSDWGLISMCQTSAAGTIDVKLAEPRGKFMNERKALGSQFCPQYHTEVEFFIETSPETGRALVARYQDGGAEDLPIVEGRREFRAGIPDAWTEDQLMRFLALNQWPSWELPARAGGSPDLFSFSATRGDRVPAKT